MLDVLSIGNLNADLLFRTRELPPIGSESEAECELKQGGSASNYAKGCARLNIKTGLMACVGEDPIAEYLIKDLRKERNLKLFIQRSSKLTGIVSVLTEGQVKRMIAGRGANKELTLTDIPDSLILTLSTSTERTLKKAIRLKGRAELFLDPGSELSKKGIHTMLKHVSILSLNDKQAWNIFREDYKHAAKLALRAGVKLVCIKRGEKGCYVTNGKDEANMPALKTRVIDTTGAGDAFNAGFTYALLNDHSLLECAQYALATAKYSVERAGAEMPSVKELKTYFRKAYE